MRTMICVMLALGLVTTASLAAADDPEPTAEGPLGTECVEVNIHNDPPVYTYECDDGPLPP